MSPSFHVTQYPGTGIHVGEAADRGSVPKPARWEGSPPTTSLEANVLPRAACTTTRDASFLLRTLRTHDREASERRRCNRDSKGMESTSENETRWAGGRRESAEEGPTRGTEQVWGGDTQWTRPDSRCMGVPGGAAGGWAHGDSVSAASKVGELWKKKMLTLLPESVQHTLYTQALSFPTCNHLPHCIPVPSS